MFEAFRVMAGAVPGGELIERGGILIAASGLQAAMFNVAFVRRPLQQPKAELEAAAAYFEGRRLDFVVRVRNGVDPATEKAAVELGMAFTAAVPGMILENPQKRLKQSKDIEIRLANDAETLEDFAKVVAVGFGASLEMTRALAASGTLGLPDQEFYVGYVDGRCMATSTLALSHRVAGVYNVATLPEGRRRGFGEAMTAHSVRRGAAGGALIASLQASEMGRPIYERMGFRVTASYRNFERRAM
jgi:ribosomal protein S18 acetylase RimI-like enzyme